MVLLGNKLASVLFAFITAAVIASLVIISSVLIARRITAIIVVDVFALFAGSDFRAVVIVGCHVFIGVCIIKPRFSVRFLSGRFLLSDFRIRSGRVRRFRSACHSEKAE